MPWALCKTQSNSVLPATAPKVLKADTGTVVRIKGRAQVVARLKPISLSKQKPYVPSQT